MLELNCVSCNNIFLAKTKRAKYCYKYNKKRNCLTCRKPFYQLCHFKNTNFCSKTCQNNNSEVILKANKTRELLDYKDFAASQHKKAILEKYGVENVSQLDFVKEKKKLVGPTGFAREEFKEIIKDKFGVENIGQHRETQLKVKETCLEKFGVDNPWKSEEIKNKIKKTNLERYGVESVLSLPENQLKNSLVNPYRISKLNKSWKDKFLKELDLEFELEHFVENSFFADLRFKDIIVEINPKVSHSLNISYSHLTGKCKKEDCRKHLPISKYYHQDRSIIARNNNYKLFQVFDWNKDDYFINSLKNELNLLNKNIFNEYDNYRLISKEEYIEFCEEFGSFDQLKTIESINKNDYKIVGFFKNKKLLFSQMFYKDFKVEHYLDNDKKKENKDGNIFITDFGVSRFGWSTKNLLNLVYNVFISLFKNSSLIYLEDLSFYKDSSFLIKNNFKVESLLDPNTYIFKENKDIEAFKSDKINLVNSFKDNIVSDCGKYVWIKK